jgi:hypothetical protein
MTGGGAWGPLSGVVGGGAGMGSGMGWRGNERGGAGSGNRGRKKIHFLPFFKTCFPQCWRGFCVIQTGQNVALIPPPL